MATSNTIPKNENDWTSETSKLKEVSQAFSPGPDADILKSIEARAELHAQGLTETGSEKQMAELDIADFEKMEDPTYQRFAAVQIADNISTHPEYKASFEELLAQHPGLTESISGFNEQNERLIAAKEDRKAAELMPEGGIDAPLVIDPATLEQMARYRARDSAAVREALNLNSLEPNLDRDQQKLAGDGEANRSAWLQKAGEAKASQAAVVNNAPENRLVSDETFTAGQGVEVKPVIPPEIESQYLRTGDKFYHPKTPELVAFEDKGNKLETKSDSENISHNLVQIAQARGWNEIKISGSEKFRQEVWVEASTRGMAVKGYSPSEADKAQVAKRISEIEPNKVEKDAAAFRGREKETSAAKEATAKPDSENQRMADTFAKESSADALKKYPQLAGAVALAAAIDKQAQTAGLTPEQRAIGAAHVHQKITNSIERGDIPPPMKIQVATEVKRDAAEDMEQTR